MDEGIVTVSPLERMDPGVEAWVVEQYKAGVKLSDITERSAEQAGREVSRPMIYRILKRNGIMPQRAVGDRLSASQSAQQTVDATLDLLRSQSEELGRLRAELEAARIENQLLREQVAAQRDPHLT